MDYIYKIFASNFLRNENTQISVMGMWRP